MLIRELKKGLFFNMQSELSKKREQKRNTPETQEFRLKILDLVKDAETEVGYSIMKDLACMTNMPFYKNRPKKIKIKKDYISMLKAYVKLLINHHDEDFAIKTIRSLNKNQAQLLRKVAPKIGTKKDIWEHAIPAKVIVDEIIIMIKRKDITMLDILLNIYCQAGQRALTKEEDQLLSHYKSSMPDGWDWKDKDVNPLARHAIVGIMHK